MPQSNDNGKKLENTIFMHLNRTRLPFDKITYYQGNAECDFVVQREDCVMMLLQVTWSMADAGTRAREINGLLEASSVTDCNQLFIITNEDEETILADGKTINVLPAWK